MKMYNIPEEVDEIDIITKLQCLRPIKLKIKSEKSDTVSMKSDFKLGNYSVFKTGESSKDTIYFNVTHKRNRPELGGLCDAETDYICNFFSLAFSAPVNKLSVEMYDTNLNMIGEARRKPVYFGRVKSIDITDLFSRFCGLCEDKGILGIRSIGLFANAQSVLYLDPSLAISLLVASIESMASEKQTTVPPEFCEFIKKVRALPNNNIDYDKLLKKVQSIPIFGASKSFIEFMDDNCSQEYKRLCKGKFKQVMKAAYKIRSDYIHNGKQADPFIYTMALQHRSYVHPRKHYYPTILYLNELIRHALIQYIKKQKLSKSDKILEELSQKSTQSRVRARGPVIRGQNIKEENINLD